MIVAPSLPDTVAAWRVLRWEPMLGSGESLSVAVIVEFDQQVSSFPLVREHVYKCLYGEQGAAAKAMVDHATEAAVSLAQAAGLEAADSGMEGFRLDRSRTTQAESALVAARQAASLFSSMSAFDLGTIEAPPEEETSPRFAAAVTELVRRERPTLARYFNQKAYPIEQGEPVRFAFLSNYAAIQLSQLQPRYRSTNVERARTRMWELMTVVEESGRRAGLIVGVPSRNDPTLTQKAADDVRRWIDQLVREGDRHQVLVKACDSNEQAARELMAFAGTD